MRRATRITPPAVVHQDESRPVILAVECQYTLPVCTDRLHRYVGASPHGPCPCLHHLLEAACRYSASPVCPGMSPTSSPCPCWWPQQRMIAKQGPTSAATEEALHARPETLTETLIQAPAPKIEQDPGIVDPVIWNKHVMGAVSANVDGDQMQVIHRLSGKVAICSCTILPATLAVVGIYDHNNACSGIHVTQQYLQVHAETSCRHNTSSRCTAGH